MTGLTAWGCFFFSVSPKKRWRFQSETGQLRKRHYEHQCHLMRTESEGRVKGHLRCQGVGRSSSVQQVLASPRTRRRRPPHRAAKHARDGSSQPFLSRTRPTAQLRASSSTRTCTAAFNPSAISTPTQPGRDRLPHRPLLQAASRKSRPPAGGGNRKLGPRPQRGPSR